MAGLQQVDDLDLLKIEFTDRFGELPDDFKNLFYLFKVKILAEECGLASVSTEGEQFILRFPVLGNNEGTKLEPIGMGTRIGKNAYWWPYRNDSDDWKDELLTVLDKIKRVNLGEAYVVK